MKPYNYIFYLNIYILIVNFLLYIFENIKFKFIFIRFL